MEAPNSRTMGSEVEEINETRMSSFPDFVGPKVDLPLWARIVEVSYLIIIGLIGIPGNTMILLVQRRNRNKSSTDILVATMAMYELICSSANVAVKILMYAGPLWIYIASNTLCRIHCVFIYITTFSSLYILAAIAVDRYFKTCKPLSNMYTTTVSKVVCVLASVGGFMTGASSVITFRLDEVYDCTISKKYEKLQHNWDTGVTTSIAVTFLVFAFSYANIAITLRKRIRMRRATDPTGRERGEYHTNGRTGLGWLSKLRKVKVEPVSSQITESTIQLAETSGVDRSRVAKDAAERVKEDDNFGLSERSASTAQTDSGFWQSNTQRTATCGNQTCLRRRHPTMAEVTLNRTTKIMFLLTIIYVVVWSVVCLCVLTTDTIFGRIVEKMSKSAFMINCITNPILFFCMSSKYRANAKLMFSRRRQR